MNAILWLHVSTSLIMQKQATHMYSQSKYVDNQNLMQIVMLNGSWNSQTEKVKVVSAQIICICTR